MTVDETDLSVTHDVLTLPDGRRLEWSSVGPVDGPVLLDHHGTPGSRHVSRIVARAAVRRGLRFVTTSRPGYGGSDRHAGRSVADVAADSAALLDALRADSAYVSGGSGGGPHALACGALLGHRVRAVAVIAGVAPYDAEGLDWLAGMGEDNVVEFTATQQGEAVLRPLLDTFRPELLNADAEGVLAVLGGLLPDVDRACLTGEVVEDAAASMAESVSVSVDGWLDDDLAFAKPWGFGLEALASVRVSIWQGDADLMVPFAHGQWLAGRLPGARVHLLTGEGHLSIGVGHVDAILDELIDR